VATSPPTGTLTFLFTDIEGSTRLWENDAPAMQAALARHDELLKLAIEERGGYVFKTVGVFSGGRTLEATEAICDAEGDLPVDVFDGISSLVDKSLLRQEEGPNGEPRFVMLETVHEYAREKLRQSGEAEEIKRVHAEYFLTLVEEAHPELKGANQLQWLERLEAEHDNMRAALSWVLERKEAELALRLGGALWWFWWMRGYQSEGRRRLEEALAIDERVSPEVRAMALAGAGALALEQGDLDRAKEACEEGLELLANEAREGSEAKLCLLGYLGWVAWEREELDQATELFEESLALSREMSHTWWLASSLSKLAFVSHFQGDYEKATELYEQSMDRFREQGEQARPRQLSEQSCNDGVLPGRPRAGCTAHRRGRRAAAGAGYQRRRLCWTLQLGMDCPAPR
jgi:tetratricopeptide (TPR) repeat protein